MLAHALARTAHARGYKTTLLTRAQCDVAKPEQVDRVLREHHPEVLLNCAAFTKVDACETESESADAVNGYAVKYLLHEASETGIKLVHFGSDFVFDGSSRRPYREDDRANPLSAYGRSKYLGESALLANPGGNWLLLRTAWLYGSNGVCFPRTMIDLARKGVPLSIVNDQIGSPTFTNDLADATFDLLERDAKGLFHVVNSEPASWFDLAVATLEEFGISHPVAPISTAAWRAKRPGQAIRPAYSVLDTALLARTIDRPMRPWREALRKYAADVRGEKDSSR
jgi:dTDP-4-dehydrorhamnose reductase